MVGNFKLPEQATNFSQIQVKMNKLTHQIEDELTIDLESCKIEDIRHFINDYDTLYEQLDYSFPNFIKNRVKKMYSGKKVLPNILNCEISFVKIDDSIRRCNSCVAHTFRVNIYSFVNVWKSSTSVPYTNILL